MPRPEIEHRQQLKWIHQCHNASRNNKKTICCLLPHTHIFPFFGGSHFGFGVAQISGADDGLSELTQTHVSHLLFLFVLFSKQGNQC